MLASDDREREGGCTQTQASFSNGISEEKRHEEGIRLGTEMKMSIVTSKKQNKKNGQLHVAHFFP